MKITQVVVSAGRVIPHPSEQFSNLRPSVSFTAIVEEGEDPLVVTRKLQETAERTIEEHKLALIAGIQEIEAMAEATSTIKQLESTIADAQERLHRLRNDPNSMRGPRQVERRPLFEESFDPDN